MSDKIKRGKTYVGVEVEHRLVLGVVPEGRAVAGLDDPIRGLEPRPNAHAVLLVLRVVGRPERSYGMGLETECGRVARTASVRRYLDQIHVELEHTQIYVYVVPYRQVWLIRPGSNKYFVD